MTLCHISVCDLFPVLPAHSHNSLQVCLNQVANCTLDLVAVQKVTWDKDDITLTIYIYINKFVCGVGDSNYYSGQAYSNIRE